ncbi:hypothetical protein [Rufibacter sp. DG15C]|uniref:hypothetical protein n=1 Tax=Rufibacter sp. DG15C TaxID=1379909 RepID=UPI000B2D7811|nr:hypothetical protein [Rufibacter sp. DG15C]
MKGSGNSPKQNRPTQDNSWQAERAQDQNAGQNNSNRHNNNPENKGSAHKASTYSHQHPDGSSHQNTGNANQQNTNMGAGVSGRPNNTSNDSSIDSKNAPKFQDGPVAGGADNTRGENVPSREGQSGGAKKGKFDPEAKSPQGSNANWSDTRGADSSDKEFKNNQPNASTLKGHKSNENLGNEKE